MPCDIKSKDIGSINELKFNFCDCPAKSVCGTGIVRTNGVEYYMCDHYKPPTCKRGQIALIIEGLQVKIECKCRNKKLVQGKKSHLYDEFKCSRPRSKIWVKKIQTSSEQNSAEYYNVYRR